MSHIAPKIIECFVKALEVNHYYWACLDGDSRDGSINLANLQKIVEKMTGISIIVKFVDFEGSFIRGYYKRYENRAEIFIRLNQSDAWRRYTFVKELCHALLDTPADYEPDPIKTIKGITKKSFITDSDPLAVKSELIAETMATELYYPIEIRRTDILLLRNGVTMVELATARSIPLSILEDALDDEYHTSCEGIWQVIPKHAPPALVF